MSNEPKAGKGIDPEMLAAYIDNRLPPEQRAAVEAQLATDSESYALLVDTLEALDDDEIKALEVKEPSKQPIPFAPTSPKSPLRKIVFAGGALAAAAAIVLIAWTEPSWLRRLRGQTERDALIARLVEAVGDERLTEPRLIGGFDYGVLRNGTRSAGGDSANLALLASAGEIQKLVASSPTPERLRLWATAKMLTGDAAGAVEVLSDLLADSPEDAALHSDLAAALLSLAAAGELERLPLALDHARRATELQPRLAEAAFNHALALEAFSLWPQALEEWRRFTSLEFDAGWKAEGERRIREIEARPKAQSATPIGSELDSLAVPSDAELKLRAPEWREALDGALLVSVVSSPNNDGWEKGLSLARRLSEVTGDSLTAAIWTHASQNAKSPALVRGLAALKKSNELVADRQLSQAYEAFRDADRLLRESRSPAVAWTEFYIPYCQFFLGRTSEAMALLEPLVVRSLQDRHRFVAVRAKYLVGLGWLRMGHHATALDVQQGTAALASEVGERSFETRARAEVADAFERLSMPDASWRERVIVLRRSSDDPERSVLHVSTVSASRAAATRGLPSAAAAFADAALENGVQWGNAAAQAEARIRLADAAYRHHDVQRALELLDEADRNLDALPDSVFAEGWRADLELLRAEAAISVSTVEALAASDRALEILKRRSTPFRTARARWVRGRALATQNPGLAKQDFEEGLAASTAQPAAIDPFGRSLADQRWLLVKDLLSLPETAAGTELAAVLRVMLGDSRADLVGTLQGALGPEDSVLVLVALEDRLLRWRITSLTVVRDVLNVGRSELERAIAVQARSLRQPTSAGWQRASDVISDLVLRGLPRPAPDSRLAVVTDEVTSKVVLATLRWPDTDLFVGESNDVVVIAGGRDVGFRRRALTGQRALIIGDPATSSSTAFVRLPGARQEAADVAAMYSDVAILIGEDASSDRVAAALPLADIVHYAGHAVGDRADPTTSRLVLAAEKGRSSFTAAEILKLQINARVVVLAACQGALAASAGNVPVRGLASSFLKAGADAVVASEWDVDDRHTASLLRRFHHWLVTGAPTSRALRLAQVDLRKDPAYAHPYYWAGFGVYSTIN